MAKKAKETAPVAPLMSAAITLAMVAEASNVDPFFLYVPAEVSAEWLEKGLVETNADMTDGAGALATRITEAGRNYLTMNTQAPASETHSTDTTGAAGGSAPAAENSFGFEIEDGPMPETTRNPASQNAARYPFDQLAAPTKNDDGSVSVKRFFIPATAARPKPWESLASTVSTAKSRYARKVGERKYKAKEAIKNADGTPVMGADGKPAFREVEKTRDINEFDREFKITEGVKKVPAEDGTETEIKGAWVSRTK